MKKRHEAKEPKKLQLSRETLRTLANPEDQKVVVGGQGGYTVPMTDTSTPC